MVGTTTRTATRRGLTRRNRFAVALFLITLVGLAWRVGYVLWMRNEAVSGDGLRYHFGALFLADGLGFINPIGLMFTGRSVADAGHPPGWTVVLAGPTALGMRSWLSHQLIACVIGGATIVMTGLAGRVAFGRRTGLIAAALVAAYPGVWLYEREVVSEPLAMLGVATTIFLAYKFRASPRPALAVALGATVGVLAMTRSEQLAIALVLVTPLILATPAVDWRRRVSWLAMAAIACAIVMAPWSIYLSTRFDRPVLLSGSLGGAMRSGNCEQTYHGELLGYFRWACALGTGATGDPLEVDAQLRRAAVEFMNQNRSRVPVVAAARVGRTFGVFRPLQQTRFETERGTQLWVTRLAMLAYWLLVPMAVAGAVIARRRRIPIYPLLVFPAVVVASVLLTIGSVRYRAPAEIPLVLLAAVAVDAALQYWHRRDDAWRLSQAGTSAPDVRDASGTAVPAPLASVGDHATREPAPGFESPTRFAP